MFWDFWKGVALKNHRKKSECIAIASYSQKGSITILEILKSKRAPYAPEPLDLPLSLEVIRPPLTYIATSQLQLCGIVPSPLPSSVELCDQHM